jgi:cytochrome c oxidase cbb3-type subunit I/II
MYDPQSISPGSIMPRYQWLIKNQLDNSTLQSKMEVMATLGVPYSKEDIANALKVSEVQALKIETKLLANEDIKKAFGKETAIPLKDREIIALIAYLQRLGTDTQVKSKK